MGNVHTPTLDPARFAVSPRFRGDKLSRGGIENKIDVFEDQIQGWILDHARALLSDQYARRQHAGLAVLMLTGAYLETIASFTRGESSRNRSTEFFVEGFKAVFPATEPATPWTDEVFRGVANEICEQLRCGLFHESMIRGKVVIRAESECPVGVVEETMTHENASIVINPEKFLGSIEAHFKAYVSQLRDPVQTELRANFERTWDCRMSQAGPLLPEQFL